MAPAPQPAAQQRPTLVHGAWEDALRRWRVLRLARRVRAARDSGSAEGHKLALAQYSKVSEAVARQAQAAEEAEKQRQAALAAAAASRTRFAFERLGADGKPAQRFTWTDQDAAPEEAFVPAADGRLAERVAAAAAEAAAPAAAPAEAVVQLPPPGVAAREAAEQRREARAGKGKGKGKGAAATQGGIEEQIAARKRRREDAEAENRNEQEEEKKLVQRNWGDYLATLKRQKQEVDAKKQEAKEVAARAEAARKQLADILDSDSDSESG